MAVETNVIKANVDGLDEDGRLLVGSIAPWCPAAANQHLLSSNTRVCK